MKKIKDGKDWFGFFLMLALVAIAWILVLIGSDDEYNIQYDVDYDNLQYEITVESTQYLDGYIISIEDFTKLKKNQAKEELNGIRELLGNKLYKKMLECLDSKYFKGYCENEYGKTYNVLQNLFSQVTAINTLYEESGLKTIRKECLSDDCEILNYIDKYTTGEVNEILKQAHMKYETLIENESDKDFDTEEIEKLETMYYAEDLCTNMDYVDRIHVRIKMIQTSVYKDNKKSENYNLVNITNKNSDVLKLLTLYKCYGFYDEDFHMNNYRNKLAMKNGKKKNKRVTTFSICNMNDEDSFRLEYEILDCKHTIKQFAELEDELHEKAVIHLKEKNLMEKIENLKSNGEDYSISIEDFIDGLGLESADSLNKDKSDTDTDESNNDADESSLGETE